MTVQTGGAPEGSIPFIYGHVDPDLLPADKLAVACAEVLRGNDTSALNYGVEAGLPELREWIAKKLHHDESLDLSLDEIIITAGSSGGLDSILRLFTSPGDTVLVEAPSYHEALALIRDHPVQIQQVTTDAQGPIIESFE
ncbi:MAG: aminotransferase class I/II-fold pyridoxal phosphate-dependent enzyme, partial [Chloroflexota bacterium]